MGIANIAQGVDLTKPKATPGWLVGAVVSIAILIGVFGIASFLFNKAKSTVSGVTAKAGDSLESMTNSESGWL